MEIDNVLLAVAIGWLVELVMAYLLGAEAVQPAPQAEIAFVTTLALLVPYLFLGYELVQALVVYYVISTVVFLIIGAILGVRAQQEPARLNAA